MMTRSCGAELILLIKPGTAASHSRVVKTQLCPALCASTNEIEAPRDLACPDEMKAETAA
jgi:hypothetical protein